MTDQPSEGLRYTQFLAITILTCLVAQSIGLLIGTVAPSLPVGISVIKCFPWLFSQSSRREFPLEFLLEKWSESKHIEEGGERGEEETLLTFLPSPPSFPFFARVPTFLTISRGNDFRL